MLEGRRIAVVEDDEVMGASLVQRLELEGAEVTWLRQVTRAIGALRTPRAPIDAVVCDIRLPDGTGEELFRTLLETASPPPFLFVTGHGGVDQAVRLLKAGAADYITKPFEMPVFLERLALLLAPARGAELPPVLGISGAARHIERLLATVARGDAPVLIRGEPGLGKAAVARRIHDLSDRRSAPFRTINLARTPDVTQALFGAEGALRSTGEGTLVLQSLRHLPQDAQNQLLAVLDRGFPGRVVATCDIDLAATAAEGGFNSDLYYLLAATEITVPPLAERPEDALWLLGQIFAQANSRREVPLEGISRLAEEAVRAYPWPGGGREIRARVLSGVETAAGTHLQPADLFPERFAGTGRVRSLAEAREEAERLEIIRALEATGGHIGQAARLLRVSRTTLWDRMSKLGIGSGTP